MNRRLFLEQGLKIGAGLGLITAVPMDVLASYRKAISPGDKIGVGLIGCNGMGWANLTSMLKIPEVTCVALCDVDENVLQRRLADLDKINIKPKPVKDYRDLLAMKEIDAVIIATPDHWHCLMMVDASAAGKHVYVEKPAANSITELSLMEEAAKNYGNIVQVGQWQRSQQHFKDALAFVQSGKLGTVAAARTWIYSNTTALPVVPNEQVPAGVDYAKWLGPATSKPFNKNHFHYQFRWYWDYAGGLMTDWGVHLIDMALQGMDATNPKSVVSTGGKFAFPGDARETPDTQSALFTFHNFQLSWEHVMGTGTGVANQMNHGIAFVGSNGTLLLNRDGWEAKPDNNKMQAVAWQKRVDNGIDLHTANFIQAMQTKNASMLNCPIEKGALVARVCHMGNIALRTGMLVNWNEEKGSFNEKAANKLLTPTYHNGYKLPVV